MDCPHCRTAMVREEGCCSCSECGGVWFGLDEARAYFGFLTSTVPPDGEGPAHWTPSLRQCPSCPSPLRHVEVGEELSLDQCERCCGLFFDAGESLKLRSLLASGHGGPTFRMQVMQIIAAPPAGPYR